MSERSLISDGAWLAGLQGLAVVGQLAAIRVLTDILPPSVFGEFSLWLGVVTLVAGGLANPTMQAVLRYYPEYALRGQGELVRAVASEQLTRLLVRALPVFTAGCVAALLFSPANVLVLVLLTGLVVVELARMRDAALLNASRAHRAYGSWAVAEAWARPALAWTLVKTAGVSVAPVLGGFLLASLCIWLAMQRFVPRDTTTNIASTERPALANRFWQYSLPLLPLGLLGWVSGMADRYMIGALISPADAGLYVAIYGLASRPMLLLGGILETAFSPAYQAALAEGAGKRAHDYLRNWALLVIIGSLATVALASILHPWVAGFLLGERYRSVSYLLPWIAGGYALLVLSHVANRVCYANEATRSILLIESTGALLAIVLGFIGVAWAGLQGAAVAISLYYGVQMIVAFLAARHWLPVTSRPLAERP
jgi:O-antigen/teichoic acid export membrane protein